MDGYASFVNHIAHAYLPDKNKHSDLHELIKLYQLARHSKTFHSIKITPAHLILEKFLSKQTIITKTTPSNMNQKITNL